MRLNINIDHVATLRNQRDTAYPSPVDAAKLCLAAGADGITAHLREDRRHIRDDDIRALRQDVAGLLNLEMAATQEMCAIADRVGPDVVTLVPEKREERTTEGGLDVAAASEAIEQVAAMCTRRSIKLSLFIEPSVAQVEASHRLGARQVEFHTGHYTLALAARRSELLTEFAVAAQRAHELGLEVAAGHGLTIENVGPIVKIPHLVELNIGHSVVCHAVLIGMSEAVRALRLAIEGSEPRESDHPVPGEPSELARATDEARGLPGAPR